MRRRRGIRSLVLSALPALLLLMLPHSAAGQASPGAARLALAAVFTDGVVLQRDATLPVWGRAAPGEAVAVSFRGATVEGRANGAGEWEVRLPAQQAGGPFELTVVAGGSRLTLRDVLVGDVWVASGQSNMEWQLRQAQNGAADAAAANDPLLRHFFVPHDYALTPQAELRGGPWRPANATYAGEFTAVGYYFARDLRKELNVPIGILHTSWGGANIETWISAAGQGLSASAADSLRQAEQRLTQVIRDTLSRRLGGLPSVDSGLVAGRALWADPALDDASWRSIRAPRAWEMSGYPGLDGVAWYRTTFELTAADAAKPVRLTLGTIDDDDITWVNGVEVGRTEGYAIPRAYDVPAAALRAGRNVVAVRVADAGGEGGLMGRQGPLGLEVGGERRELPAEWKFRVAVVEASADGQRINKVPSFLYNAMVHPLLRFPIKGVIWYQGESNANNDEQAIAYEPLFKQLIESWRNEWLGGRGSPEPFPFLWVQLPNYGRPDTVPPATSGWALLRESQTAALALPNTGEAVAIELGNPADIHPRNKTDVGARLALAALKVAYGRDVVASGPRYRRHSIASGRVTVEFDNAAGGLVNRALDGSLKGFAIAGADGQWHWADARIDGERVILSSERVPQPVAVRYAWSNSPTGLSLYNRSGLPAAPFRTDRPAAPPPSQGASTPRQESRQGAAVTGQYRNLFREAGRTDAEIRQKLDAAWQQLFHGDSATQTLFYWAGQNERGRLAFVSDINNRDVRSEGMSYAMMIAAQLDKQAEFDALWNWSRTYMYNADPKHPAYKYYSWSMNLDGTPRSESPAPDGEEYWVMALYFASGRWGDGQGIYNYRAMADELLDDIKNRGVIQGPWKSRPERIASEGAQFHPEHKMVRFTPDTNRPDHTDPSYHLPHFYELWGRWGPEKDRAFWLDAARISRDFFQKVTHPVTGLAPEYANYDGTPVTNSFNQRSSTFGPDAWRTAGNWAVDWSWWAADPREQVLSDRIQAFFESQGEYGNRYSLDGTQKLEATHSTALVANNAIVSLAATNTARARKFVDELWNTEIPTGQYRYYDGMWYIMALMHVSGNFKVWTPRGLARP